MASHWTSMCLSVHQSYVRPSIFRFRMITRVNINGFSPNLVCALILWRSGLRLLMGKFHQMFTELSARDTIMAGYYKLTFLLRNMAPLNVLKICTPKFLTKCRPRSNLKELSDQVLHHLPFQYYYFKKQLHKKQNLGKKKKWNKVYKILVHLP